MTVFFHFLWKCRTLPSFPIEFSFLFFPNRHRFNRSNFHILHTGWCTSTYWHLVFLSPEGTVAGSVQTGETWPNRTKLESLILPFRWCLALLHVILRGSLPSRSLPSPLESSFQIYYSNPIQGLRLFWTLTELKCLDHDQPVVFRANRLNQEYQRKRTGQTH